MLINITLVSRASELHLSIPLSKRNASQPIYPPPKFSTSTPARVRSPPPLPPFEQSPALTQPLGHAPINITPARHPHAPALHAQPEDARAMEADLEYQERDNLVTALACFEAREFLRAKFILEECRSSKAHFLSVYSRFIVSQFGFFGGLMYQQYDLRRVKKWPNAIGTNSIVCHVSLIFTLSSHFASPRQ